MPTEKQLAANRANAQRSTGPRSESGKQRSRLNATRHGLSGQVVVLPEEDLAAFNQFVAEIVATFAPADALERQLAQSFANYQWRINRAAAIENNMLTLGIIEGIASDLDLDHPQAQTAATHAKTFRADSAGFARLALYAQRLVNQSEKVLRQLTELQTKRKQREQSEMPAAITIYNLHKMNGVTFNPQQNGFVLTLPQIEAQIHRDNLAKPAYVAKMTRRKAA